METHTRVSIRMGKPMVKGSTRGLTERSTTGNGWMVSRKGMECGKETVATLTLGNGRSAKLMGTECMCGKTVTSTRVNGRHVSDMGMGQTSSPMVTCILVNTNWVSLTVMVNTNGPTEIHTLALFLTDLSMGRANGRNDRMLKESYATTMKVSMHWIRRMDGESLNGKAAMFTRGSTWTMSEMASERCIGQMAASTREHG